MIESNMKIHYYYDPETGHPHIFNHNVSKGEVMDVLIKPGEDRSGRDGSRVAMGQTSTGRYLKVIYVFDLEPKSIFVITAFDLLGKPLMAHKRRMNK